MTTSAFSAIRSVTLSLPSSTHWAPTTTSPGMRRPSPPGRTSLAVFGSSFSIDLLERSGSGLDGALDRRSAEVPLAKHIGELRIPRQESEHDLAHGTVAVLRDDYVCLTRTLRVAVVVLVSVDEHHEVGVLLDLPRFAQVREQRLLVRPRLDATRELRHGDNRHLQLARQHLEPAADLADLLDAAVGAVLGAHELQVVDDHEAELVARVEAARLGTQVEDAEVARVVDVERRRGELLGGLDDLRPAVGADAPLPEVVAVPLRLRGEEALRELGLGHLERELGDRLAVIDGRVLGDV